MPRKREGYTQIPFEVPDELHAAIRTAAERDGLRLTTWICTACAALAGVEYHPPRLGRPPAVEPKEKPARKARARRKG